MNCFTKNPDATIGTPGMIVIVEFGDEVYRTRRELFDADLLDEGLSLAAKRIKIDKRNTRFIKIQYQK